MPAYNNYGFPATYQPMYPNAYAQQPQQVSYAPPAPTPQTGIIWVQGEAGAKAYPVAAGSNVLLMDSESECFYIKSTDASGMPMPLRTFRYEEIVQTQEVPPQQSHALPDKAMLDQYAKKEDLQVLEQKIDDLAKMRKAKGAKDGE